MIEINLFFWQIKPKKKNESNQKKYADFAIGQEN